MRIIGKGSKQILSQTYEHIDLLDNILEFRLMLYVVFLFQAISIECTTGSVIFELV